MKLNEKELDKVTGGKIIETKDGKFMSVADETIAFDTENDAQQFEKFRKDHKHPGGPHINLPLPHFKFKDLTKPHNEMPTANKNPEKPE